MRLSGARNSQGQRVAAARTLEGGTTLAHTMQRGIAALMATLILVATMGVVVARSAKPAGADTFGSGQVFVPYGFGDVDVYDSSGNYQTSLIDNTNSQNVAGSAFDAQGNFYVADGSTNTISEFSPTGAPLPTFATGLKNPAALVFDQAGDLYVGQIRSPYIAEFSPTGQRMPDIGPLKTELFGVDWIDLSSDQCTFYYTTERSDIMTYNQCTNTQGPNFNQAPLPGPAAFELRIISGGTFSGDILVADSDAVLRLDSTGNVVQTYPCSSLPGCGAQHQLFGLAVDPSGTSFWTMDLHRQCLAGRHRHGNGAADDKHERALGLRVVRRRRGHRGSSPDLRPADLDRPGDQPGLIQLRVADNGVCRAYRHDDRHDGRHDDHRAGPRGAGHLHARRSRDVHRDDRQHRDGFLCHHAE